MTIEDLPEPVKEMIKKQTERTREDKTGVFYVTELLGCTRKAFYRRTFGEEIDLQQAWWFYRGNLLDDAWTPLFKRSQVRCTHRLKGAPIVIVGRFDFEDTDGAIADLKTTSDLYYVKKDGAKEEHRKQVAFYCYHEIKNKGRLYYVSFQDAYRVDLDFSEEELTEIVEELERKAVILWEALLDSGGEGKNLNPPKREDKYTKKFWECRYCSFKERCYEEESEEEEGKEGEEAEG